MGLVKDFSYPPATIAARMWGQIGIWLGLLLVVFVPAVKAEVHEVGTASELHAALNMAVAGDEIVVADGLYRGTFSMNGNAGTAEQPITVRARNRHQAIFEGQNQCAKNERAFNIKQPWWILDGLHIRNYGQPIRIRSQAQHVTIRHAIIQHFQTYGILTNAAHGRLANNVLAFGDFCTGGGAIDLRLNADHNTIVDNIILGMTDGGYHFGDKNGYGIFLSNNSDDNRIQGNLILGGGRGVLRILAGLKRGQAARNETDAPYETADRNLVRDNAFLFGQGPVNSSDCTDDSNVFINNIFYGNYFWNWYTKGSPKDVKKGHHRFQHNLVYATDLTRGNLLIGSGGCGDTLPKRQKHQVTLLDNIFYADGRTSDRHVLINTMDYPANIKQANHNLFWSPSAEAGWVDGYRFGRHDIHSSDLAPQFRDPAQGDFSLLPGSPGRQAASDGTDIGITYNRFLKKDWLRRVFGLEMQQRDQLDTSVVFPVSSRHFYHVWFYVPDRACRLDAEQFTIEATTTTRNIQGMTQDAEWLQPGGPARWISLGRHRATDGSLNVSWTTAACADKVRLRRLPNAAEAYQWIAEAVGGVETSGGTGEGQTSTGLLEGEVKRGGAGDD